MSARVRADQYTESVWDSMPHPRKFFLKHRGARLEKKNEQSSLRSSRRLCTHSARLPRAPSGFGPAHSRADLPAFRQLYLRAALGAAERACDLAPGAIEAAALRCCVLWSLAVNAERDARGWAGVLAECAGRAAADPGLGRDHPGECRVRHPSPPGPHLAAAAIARPGAASSVCFTRRLRYNCRGRTH